MKNFKHFIIACGLWSLAWFGTVQPVTWASNLFVFITWVSLFMFFAGHIYTKEAQLKSYRDGKHAAEWFDWMTYGIIILICGAMAHHGKGVAWLLMLSIDLSHRNEAKKGEPKP